MKKEARKASKIKNKELEVSDIANERSKRLYIFCKNMMSKSLNLPVESKLDFDVVNWFDRFTYHSDDDTIVCTLNSALKPYLLDFKNNHFKSLSKSNIFSFKSKYTHKFYLLLKTAQDKQFVTVDEFKSILPITYIRKLLGIEDDEYKLYGDLKRKVLIKVQEDLEKIVN